MADDAIGRIKYNIEAGMVVAVDESGKFVPLAAQRQAEVDKQMDTIQYALAKISAKLGLPRQALEGEQARGQSLPTYGTSAFAAAYRDIRFAQLVEQHSREAAAGLYLRVPKVEDIQKQVAHETELVMRQMNTETEQTLHARLHMAAAKAGGNLLAVILAPDGMLWELLGLYGTQVHVSNRGRPALEHRFKIADMLQWSGPIAPAARVATMTVYAFDEYTKNRKANNMAPLVFGPDAVPPVPELVPEKKRRAVIRLKQES